MQVLSLHPGVTRETVEENTSFELLWASDLKESEPPSGEELRLLPGGDRSPRLCDRAGLILMPGSS